MPSAGSELALPAIHRPQIYATDRPVTGTGTKKNCQIVPQNKMANFKLCQGLMSFHAVKLQR